MANQYLVWAPMLLAILTLSGCTDNQQLARELSLAAATHMQQNDFKKAGEEFQRAYDFDKTKESYRSKFAFCLARQGQFDSAGAIWKELAKSSDKDVREEATDALNNLLPRMKRGSNAPK